MEKGFLFWIIISVLFILPIRMSAGLIEFNNPLKATTTQELIDAIANFIFIFAVVLVPLMVIFAGFLILTSAGEAAKVEKAKKIFIYAIVGLFVAFFAKAIPYMIKQILGAS